MLGGQTIAKATSVPSPHSSTCSPTHKVALLVMVILVILMVRLLGVVTPAAPSLWDQSRVGGLGDENGGDCGGVRVGIGQTVSKAVPPVPTILPGPVRPRTP